MRTSLRDAQAGSRTGTGLLWTDQSTSSAPAVPGEVPETAAGGPLRLVRNGDRIRISVSERRLDLLVDEAELERRRAALPPVVRSAERGWLGLYKRHVLQAERGCDLDFLAGGAPD